MPLTITEIIAQADILVPNTNSNAEKAAWLNEINNKFFEVVKIPNTASLTTIAGTATYALTNAVRGKNIQKAHVGKSLFPSFLYDDVNPGNNYHLFDDTTFILTLVPTPTQILPGIVRYFRMATTTYIDSAPSLASNPDAPSEFHYIYVYGLAQKIAEAAEDLIKANNYGNQFIGNLSIAQQNYAGK